MAMKPVSWPQVTLILGIFFLLIGGTVVLAIYEKDVTVILTIAGLLAVPVLTAFGAVIYGKMEQVKGNMEQVKDTANGGQLKLLEALKETQRQLTRLAMSVAPPPAAAVPLAGDTLDGDPNSPSLVAGDK